MGNCIVKKLSFIASDQNLPYWGVLEPTSVLTHSFMVSGDGNPSFSVNTNSAYPEGLTVSYYPVVAGVTYVIDNTGHSFGSGNYWCAVGFATNTSGSGTVIKRVNESLSDLSFDYTPETTGYIVLYKDNRDGSGYSIRKKLL